jgi:protein translocase SecG subunit
MQEFLLAAQIFFAVALILAVLVQTKGTGFGRVWGAGPKSFTRRGLEKIVFKMTFFVAFALVVVSILQIII